MKLGLKVVILRKNAKLSQEDLANELGVSRQSISLWETNQSLPSTDKLIELAKFFNVTIDDLVNDDITLDLMQQQNAKELDETIVNLKSTFDKNKSNYINFFILALGIWLLSNIMIVTIDNFTPNMAVAPVVGISIMIVGLVVQGVNANYFRQKLKGINSKQNNLLFNTTYYFIYLSVATILFALFFENVSFFRYDPAYNYLYKDLVLYNFVFVYLTTLIIALAVYLIVRSFNFSYLTKMKLSSYIFKGILLIILIVPLLIVSNNNSHKLGVKTNNPYIQEKQYNKADQIDEYYQLKYLYLQSIGEATMHYDNNTNKHFYQFDDGYELFNDDKFIDLISTNHIDYDISDEVAIAFYSTVDQSRMDEIIYSYFTVPPIILWSISVITYTIIVRKRKTLKIKYNIS